MTELSCGTRNEQVTLYDLKSQQGFNSSLLDIPGVAKQHSNNPDIIVLIGQKGFSNTLRFVSSPGGGEVFCTRPDRPWGPPSLLYNEYRVSFPGVKRARRGVDRPPHLAPRLKKE
jgi:hypothetical protein